MRARRGRCFRSSIVAALAGVTLLATSAAAWSRTDSDGSVAKADTLVGSYLAGRFARAQNATDEAASFYGDALRRDPDSEVLLEQSFLMEATEGRWPRAVALARELTAKQPTHKFARLVLALTEFNSGNFQKADQHFLVAADGPIAELTTTLARAWTKLANGDAQVALDTLEVPAQAEWAQDYMRFHRALIGDVGKRTSDARTAYERVFRQDNRTLRIALAYAQHAAHAGDRTLAKSILKDFTDRAQGDGHPLALALRTKLQGDGKIELLVPTPASGLAEVFYGLGEALAGEGGTSIGVMYLQMALYVVPDHPLALIALAQAYEASKKYTNSNDVYARVPPNSPLQQTITIQKAFNLAALEQIDEAKDLLDGAAARNPKDIRPLDALGNILRSRKRYAEAERYYTRAIALIPNPDKRHWAYFYSRGTCYERMKNWPAAEADLKRAMRLSPDQPLVLNYLGYSWIDQNKNLKQGLKLIEKAVQLKPDDGYIVDSLGWAHFKLGNFKESVRLLEQAVELRPEDPVLNDHLGDALWRVGREREARYQWDQALMLKPEPEETEKIKKKLANGLAPRGRAPRQKTAAETGETPPPKKRVENQLTPAAPRVQ